MGRGKSGLREHGFQYQDPRTGRTVTMQKTGAGVTLLDGKPTKVDYQKVLNSAKTKPGFRTLDHKDLEKKRHDRYSDKHDYELLDDTRGKKKLIYRPRKQR